MKTKSEIKEKIEGLESDEVMWTLRGIITKMPSAQAMIDALKWVLEDEN